MCSVLCDVCCVLWGWGWRAREILAHTLEARRAQRDEDEEDDDAADARSVELQHKEKYIHHLRMVSLRTPATIKAGVALS